jgi:drug/metabolite transporter (DMT)-like permease
LPRPLATLLLVITALLWGLAFVAQKSAMDTMGPLTFAAVRYALGTLILVPVVLWEVRRNRRTISPREWRLILALALAFFLGVYLQQYGLKLTTVTNGGFLTTLYVLLVPLLAFVAVRQVPHPIVWLCMPMATLGVFLLNGGHLDQFNFGDILLLFGAIAWAVQVLLLGHLARVTGLPIAVSVVCFGVTALLSGVGAATIESPSLAAIVAGWPEIAYTGILSTAVAFTLQAIAQQYVPPSNSAIVLSAESLFAALGGALILGERLPAVGYFGAGLIFVAIVMLETLPILLERRTPDPM